MLDTAASLAWWGWGWGSGGRGTKGSRCTFCPNRPLVSARKGLQMPRGHGEEGRRWAGKQGLYKAALGTNRAQAVTSMPAFPHKAGREFKAPGWPWAFSGRAHQVLHLQGRLTRIRQFAIAPSWAVCSYSPEFVTSSGRPGCLWDFG